MSDITTFNNALTPMVPAMSNVLPVQMSANHINQTILHALAHNDYLARSSIDSVQSCAMTAAFLGLLCDGFTQQGFLVPFKSARGPKAQFLTGYRGHVTLAARADVSINAQVVYDDEEFEFDEAQGYILHRRKLGNRDDKRIVAAWARASHPIRPPVCTVLDLDQIISRRDRSSGWQAFQSGRSRSTPWDSDFAAMARKCPVHALSAFIPVVPLQLASALQTHHELGHHTALNQEGNIVIDGSASPVITPDATTPARPHDPLAPEWVVFMPNGTADLVVKSFDEYVIKMEKCIARGRDNPAVRNEFARLNLERCQDLAQRHNSHVLSNCVDAMVSWRDD